MVILDIVLGNFSIVFLMFSFEQVWGIGFLQQYVSHVFLILQDSYNSLLIPFCMTGWRQNALVFKALLNIVYTVPIEKVLKNHSDGLGFFRVNFRLSIRSFSVSQTVCVSESKPPIFVTHSNAFGNIAADRFTFRLGKGTQAGQNHLAVHIRGVYSLFFKNHGNPPAFQKPHMMDTIQCVTGEPGNRFG